MVPVSPGVQTGRHRSCIPGQYELSLIYMYFNYGYIKDRYNKVKINYTDLILQPLLCMEKVILCVIL